MNRSISHMSYLLGVIHISVVIISSIVAIVCFPFLANVFTQLDIVGCLYGCSLSLMAFPDAAKIGFINLENCLFYIALSIIILIALFAILYLFVRKKRLSYYLVGGVYGIDVLFLIIHYFYLQEMLDISTHGTYAVLSLLYKLIGILICYNLVRS